MEMSGRDSGFSRWQMWTHSEECAITSGCGGDSDAL